MIVCCALTWRHRCLRRSDRASGTASGQQVHDALTAAQHGNPEASGEVPPVVMVGLAGNGEQGSDSESTLTVLIAFGGKLGGRDRQELGGDDHRLHVPGGRGRALATLRAVFAEDAAALIGLLLSPAVVEYILSLSTPDEPALTA